MTEHKLGYLNDQDRLKIYNTLISGCMHLWSKNKLQDGSTIDVKGKDGKTVKQKLEDRLTPVLESFSKLAESDPLFLAHFTSYAVKKLDAKDLRVVATFASTLSDADGTPFSPGSEFKKPNWRLIGQAAFQTLDPKLALRVVQLANRKMKFGIKAEATHYSKSLRSAVRKYLRYREANPKMIEGIVRTGLTKTYRNLYRWARIQPSAEAATFLAWEQKDGSVKEADFKQNKLTFAGLSEVEIAEKIRAERLTPQRALGALGDKISPVIAAAVLEQASGDQAVILTNLFEEQGLLKNVEVKKVYEEKIKTAKNALDRVDRIKAELSEETKTALKDSRSETRKANIEDFGRVFVHVDTSPSMANALEIAKEYGATISEFVKNPEQNFFWGSFDSAGKVFPNPQKFTKDGFKLALYGQKIGGYGTDCLALYKTARQKGCSVDIYITDQDHNGKLIGMTIDECRREGLTDPQVAVIVDVHGRQDGILKRELEKAGIPVTVLTAKELGESALVTQAVNVAMKGQIAVLEEILSTGLLDLPKWWYAVKSA